MKYKAKFNLASKYYRKDYKMSCTDTILKEGEYNSEYFGSDQGVFVFIPFTDTRFFEPVKTRKFQVEVSEEHMDRFNFYVNDGDKHWTVTEITEPSWIKQFKAQYPLSASAFTQEQLDSFDPRDLIAEYGSARFEAVKWIKYHYNVGLKAAKELMDYTYANFQ